MNNTDVRERPGGTHRPGGSVFDLTVSKLLPPLVRPGTIRRPSLLDRLANEDPRRIVSVVAPPASSPTVGWTIPRPRQRWWIAPRPDRRIPGMSGSHCG